VARRDGFLKMPYDADLRGWEYLCYCRLARRFGCVAIWNEPARLYRTDAEDRLSARRSVCRRACGMARGYYRWLVEFGSDVRYERQLPMFVRLAYYASLCAAGHLVRSCSQRIKLLTSGR